MRIFSVFLFTGALLCGLFFYLNSPPGKPLAAAPSITINVTSGSARVIVRHGETSYSVGSRLKSAGLIRSEIFWDIVSRFDKDFIKQGVYETDGTLTLIELRTLLKTGRQEIVRVTIPEGVTLSRIARLISENGVCGEESFKGAARDKSVLDEYRIPGESAEGYLFPDTYNFPLDYEPRLAVKIMIDNFFTHLDEIRKKAGATGESSKSLNEKVILASIIEREYRAADEAPVMAGVFFNRMKTGMRLQSCATVEYVITEILGKPHPSRIFYSDLEIDNPYNTYRVNGLPPAPISAPGDVALSAVYNPAPSDYLYFRLTDEAAGRHRFSKTNEEHNAAVLYVKNQASP